MSVPPPGLATSDYRLSKAFAARILGGLIILLGAAVVLATLAAAILDLGPLVIGVVVGAGIVALAGAWLALTRLVPVVRLGPEGYRVRVVRGVGVAEASWKQVNEAVTSSPGGVPVVVLKLDGGRRTTIPVQVLAADREEFVRDLQAHLQRGRGLRPL